MMRRYVSAWGMSRVKKEYRAAFTLIEVMVAVMIISVVILALLNMQGNSSFIFSKLSKDAEVNQYASFFIANADYGFEKQDVRLDELLKDFDLQNQLRRELKNIKAKIIYQEIERIDMQEYEENNESVEVVDEQGVVKQVQSGMAFEIGKTIIKIHKESTKESPSTSLLRIRLQ